MNYFKHILPRLGFTCFCLVVGWAGLSHAQAANTNNSPFQVRGTLPWHNFLSGPTAWDEEDYEEYLDQLARLGMNYIAFHCYTGGAERYATYVEPLIRMEYRNVIPEAHLDTSLTARWGYRPLPISQFAFGTERLFSSPRGTDAFGAKCALLAHTNSERYDRAQDLMRKVIEMAHRRGVQVGLGFEFGIHPPEFASVVPPDSIIRGAMLPDPTHPASIEILRNSIDSILRSYSKIDWIWLWLHEHTMFVNQAQPGERFAALLKRDAEYFDRSSPEAVFTGVWSLAYIGLAQDYLRQRAPQVRLAISGWGGGVQLPPVLRGLDRALPTNIVFSCLSPGQGGGEFVSALEEIAQRRPVWAIPWLEGDAQLWHLQPRVSVLRDQVQHAKSRNLNGVLAIHWRTEETKANLEAFAEFASQPAAPSAHGFYVDYAKRQFGEEVAETMAAKLIQFDRNGILSAASPEYYAYDPGWGRLTPDNRARLKQDKEELRGVLSTLTGKEHRRNLEWLIACVEGTLLLDEVGQKIEPAYRLKEQFLRGQLKDEQLRIELGPARVQFEAAPVEALFKTFSSRVRSRGELGELSSMNQRLWLQYKELKHFLGNN